MSKLCWSGELTTFEELLISLGFSKQKIKKIGLSKKERSRLVYPQNEVTIPSELFNYGVINPTFIGPHSPLVIKEEGDILAVHKPSGVHIHPLSYNENDNLLSFLRAKSYFPYIQNFSKENIWDGGLLYRIDYETSGLVLLTSNRSQYESARNGDIHLKEYLVVVDGHYEGVIGRVSHRLSTTGTKVREDLSGAQCEIEIEVLARQQKQSLLKIKLGEGRRHQIRVQLSLLGYPIWGDCLYGASECTDGLFGLHCYHYQLESGLEFFDDNFWGLSLKE